ncbi:MAG TPA: hypothetical protein VIT23_03490 [Terrimicrobiaceae bacterium]
MRQGLWAFATVVACGLITAIIVFVWVRDRSEPMRWLHTKFSLEHPQTEKVQRIYVEYERECATMCARIAESDAQLEKLVLSSQEVTPEIQQAIVETDRLRSECRSNMLSHFYRIAAELPAERRNEYLSMVLPSLLQPGQMAQAHSR